MKTSSLIKSLRYDPSNRVLGVEFRNGSRYVYRDVPETTVHRVRDSQSIGRAYVLYVRDAFPHEKIL